MKYLEFTFRATPSGEAVYDVLAAVLAEAGFDSFVRPGAAEIPVAQRTDDPEAPLFAETEAEDALKAYVQRDLFSPEALDAALAAFPLDGVRVDYDFAEAEDRDWNEEWEQNYFQPLVVDGRCVIAGTFHKNVPRAEYHITIDPRMSFGTGHHATTSQMISELLEADLAGLRVLDMGCGTSILAILARMRGAVSCLAVDNDEWCVKNSLENLALNHIAEGVEVVLGDASALVGRGPFDLVIANINRNILLRDLALYVPVMASGASVLMSGFYDADVPLLRAEAERLGLVFDHARSLDGWACTAFRKP